MLSSSLHNDDAEVHVWFAPLQLCNNHVIDWQHIDLQTDAEISHMYIASLKNRTEITHSKGVPLQRVKFKIIDEARPFELCNHKTDPRHEQSTINSTLANFIRNISRNYGSLI